MMPRRNWNDPDECKLAAELQDRELHWNCHPYHLDKGQWGITCDRWQTGLCTTTFPLRYVKRFASNQGAYWFPTTHKWKRTLKFPLRFVKEYPVVNTRIAIFIGGIDNLPYYIPDKDFWTTMKEAPSK